ncbi:MAG: DUF308 domain-containing protein [Oscillospiraceae bacterium]|nr:DUF308 domain-containing protein [Oscillospiraceae bacterium]
MKAIKENSSSLLVSAAEIIVGILLFINPTAFTSGIIVLGGIVLIVMGAINVIAHLRQPAELAIHERRLTVGLVEIAVGLFFIIRPSWLTAVFPAVTIIYGIVMLVMGFVKAQYTVDLLRLKRPQWFLALISTVISIVAAIVILSHPLSTTAFLWNFTAIMLIVEAVIDIVTVFFKGSKNAGAGASEQ